MSLAIVSSQALLGFQLVPVRVEVHVAPGLPVFHIVGLPNVGVKESRERVRSAILNSGYKFPVGRVTVNLAPADLPKNAGHFDLPIALGVLLASGQLPWRLLPKPSCLARYIFAGELSLTGAVMPVHNALVLALGLARKMPQAILVLPQESAAMAAQVQRLKVLAANTLNEVVQHLMGQHRLLAPLPLLTPTVASADSLKPCLSEVVGQRIAKRVLEIAASGGHNVLLVGPPGCGKSMLAQCFGGLLPTLSQNQMLEVAAIQALAFPHRPPILTDQPPFRAPHHNISVSALIGGGRLAGPGEISLAHSGVLFLDELPEFSAASLEALRQPLQTGEITVARSQRSVAYPARFQLIAAMNPCPCGWAGHEEQGCRCTPDQVKRYQNRLSGPLLDRIDLCITMTQEKISLIAHEPVVNETSASVQSRIITCRRIQQQRQQTLNAYLSPGERREHCRLEGETLHYFEQVGVQLSWSPRVQHKIICVARTLADMQASPNITKAHLSEAIAYRQTVHSGV